MTDELSVLEAIVLGIVQGLTEWLPVSSSGHLVLAQEFLGVNPPVFFDLFLHVATLLVILVHFRSTIAEILVSLGSTPRALREAGWAGVWRDPMRRLAWLVAIGSIPTAIIGLFFEDQIVTLFGSAVAVGIALIVTGTFLWITQYAKPRTQEITWKHALLVGAAQGIAILPGISRSGSTIGAATLLGVDRDVAVRYSFLLYIPAVGGALILQTTQEAVAAVMADLAAYAAGFAAAVAVGYGTLIFLVFLIRRQRFHYFAPYCWALGAGVLAWVAFA